VIPCFICVILNSSKGRRRRRRRRKKRRRKRRKRRNKSKVSMMKTGTQHIQRQSHMELSACRHRQACSIAV